MEGMLTFTGIIIIVFGILQIILFFKMWGMTNNVKCINEKLKNEKYSYQFYMIIGEKEKAFQIAKEELVIKLLEIGLYTSTDEGFIRVAKNEIPKYIKLIKNTGFEVPYYLLSAEAFLKHKNESQSVTNY